MRLHAFIALRMEQILAEWDAFAATLLPGTTHRVLRDHAEQILRAVATDLQTPQSHEEQHAKAQGRAPRPPSAPETAAQTHAVLRAGSGLDIRQLASEYRALRASVLRLWTNEAHPEPSDFEDMIRFNEAIDQALAESVDFFSEQVDQARNLFLGMLGHDMRTPLQTIQMTASYLAAINAGEPVSNAAGVLVRSGQRMQALLDDLVDLNRVTLGVGLRINPEAVDLADVLRESVAQLRAANPQREIELSVAGDTRGEFDVHRIQQVLDNLVMNAIAHGSDDRPIQVAIEGEADEVRVLVTNSGRPIDPEALGRIFDPLARAAGAEPGSRHLGLGLFIARQITDAHRGTIDVQSDAEGTEFSIRLPRRAPGRVSDDALGVHA
jgi:signal transduction histidine kinase